MLHLSFYENGEKYPTEIQVKSVLVYEVPDGLVLLVKDESLLSREFINPKNLQISTQEDSL